MSCAHCGASFAAAVLRQHERWCEQRGQPGKRATSRSEDEERPSKLIRNNAKEGSEWACSSCTFANAQLSLVCEMCGRAPQPLTAPAVAQLDCGRTPCRYGTECRYLQRNDLQHCAMFAHPATSQLAPLPCRYASGCRMQGELVHNLRFSHPAPLGGRRLSIRTINCDGLRRMLRRMGFIQVA
jgi:hypothetical protein